jgi:hypothetical protein
MLVATPEKRAPAGSRECNPQRWVSPKIAADHKTVAFTVPADEPLCQIIEQRVHDFHGSLLADELGDESKLVAGQRPIGRYGIVVNSPGHWTTRRLLGWAGSAC